LRLNKVLEIQRSGIVTSVMRGLNRLVWMRESYSGSGDDMLISTSRQGVIAYKL
jgi:hypothetical protein